MNKLLPVILSFILLGCVSPIKKIGMDSGTHRYIYKCDSEKSKCLLKIAQYCESNQFQIIKEEEVRKKSMNTTGMGGVSYKTTIIFSCT